MEDLCFRPACNWSKHYPLHIFNIFSSSHFVAVRNGFPSSCCLPHQPRSSSHPPLIPGHGALDWVQPLRLEARVYLEPKRKPFRSCAPSGEGRLRRGRWGGAREDREPGSWPFPHKLGFVRASGGAMEVFSALWVLLLCQLLSSSSAQVRVRERGVPLLFQPPAAGLCGGLCWWRLIRSVYFDKFTWPLCPPVDNKPHLLYWWWCWRWESLSFTAASGRSCAFFTLKPRWFLWIFLWTFLFSLIWVTRGVFLSFCFLPLWVLGPIYALTHQPNSLQVAVPFSH